MTMTSFIQAITPLLITLAPIALPILYAYLTTATRLAFDKMPSNLRATMASIVSTGVNAVEQTAFGKMTGPEKKAAALSAIHAQLKHFGIDAPDEVLEPMLEEAVLVINLAQGKDMLHGTKPMQGGVK